MWVQDNFTLVFYKLLLINLGYSKICCKFHDSFKIFLKNFPRYVKNWEPLRESSWKTFKRDRTREHTHKSVE